MAAKKTVATAAPSNEVTVPRTVLTQFISIMEGLEHADLAYKACQASVFRGYAQGLYRSGNARMAVAQAKDALGNDK